MLPSLHRLTVTGIRFSLACGPARETDFLPRLWRVADLLGFEPLLCKLRHDMTMISVTLTKLSRSAAIALPHPKADVPVGTPVLVDVEDVALRLFPLQGFPDYSSIVGVDRPDLKQVVKIADAHPVQNVDHHRIDR